MSTVRPRKTTDRNLVVFSRTSRTEDTMIKKHITVYCQIMIVCIAMFLPRFVNAEPTVPFQLRNSLSGKCLEVADASRSNGADIQQNSCRSADDPLLDAQLWFYLHRQREDGGPGAFHIISYLNPDKCLDVTKASRNDGVPIRQYSCRNAGDDPFFEAQVWRVRSTKGYMQYQNVRSRKCLDATKAYRKDRVRIQQNSCRDADDSFVGVQLWEEIFWDSKSF